MTAVEHSAPAGEIGRSRTRVEDWRLVTGAGRFVDDIQLPGTLHMAVVRSPQAHARILGVDAGEARAAPGVRAVFVGRHVPPIDPLPGIPVAGGGVRKRGSVSTSSGSRALCSVSTNQSSTATVRGPLGPWTWNSASRA